MPETPDLKALAERYLDLWEEQFAAAAADPALAAAMAAWLGPWRALAAGAKPSGPAPAGGMGRKRDERAAGTPRKTGAGAAAAAGAAPAGAAPRDGGGGLERVLGRIERIERRLDALERKRAGKSAPARGRGGAGGGRPGGAG
ncbi:MAG TPA: hypothetical protein VIF14_15320 [Alphaproteobacteria bacterium]|jgi:hypothetical protein